MAMARSLKNRPFALRIAVFTGCAVLMLHAAFFTLVLAVSLLYTVVNLPITGIMLYRRIFYGHKPLQRIYLPLEEIPRAAPRMVVKVEDYRFYEHQGIDLDALKRAYRVNRKSGSIRQGGSTITMQLARTLFLVPVKSYARKYAEVLIALCLETAMDKRRILELYLNYAEWGEGIFGMQAASLQYYGTGVQSLSADRMRRLVTILANPLDYGVNDFWSNRHLARR
jgi:monofunctional biosynthetic peptidoglycan transglycosylase